MPTQHLTDMLLPEGADPLLFGPPLRWWRDAFAQRGGLPSRSDISPEKLTAAALPYVILVDIADGGHKLRWRLVGTAHVERNQRDLRGAYFDDVYATGSPVLTYLEELHRDLICLRHPIWAANDITHRKSNFGASYPMKVRRLLLPLSRNGRDVDMCLTVLTVEYNPDAGASYAERWRNSDYVGEIERIIIPSRVDERHASSA